MSDREFTGFDVDTVADAVRQPPLDDLWAAVRARRRRRVGGVALALVVVFAGMAVLPLTAGTRAVDWAESDRPPVRSDRAGQLFMTGPDSAVLVAVHESEDRCSSVRFRYTDDGGRTWTGDEATRYHGARCGTDALGNSLSSPEFSVLGQRSYLVEDGDRVKLSTDHGRTWRDAASAMVPVPAFPRNARPAYCQGSCGALSFPVAVDPSTGTVYRLTGAPPSPYRPASIWPGADGSIWVTHYPGEMDLPMVIARSVDRGATWNTWTPPVGAHVTAVVGVSEREAYLLIDPPPPPGAPPMTAEGPVQLLRTTDGGKSWTDMRTDLPDTEEQLAITLGVDGSLLVAETDYVALETEPPPTFTSKLWVSRDEGRHFTVARAYERRDGAVGAAPGHAWLYGRDDMTVGGADHVQLTTDGTTWTRFRLPD